MTDLNKEYLEKLENGENVIIPLHEERILIKKEKKGCRRNYHKT